MIRSLIPFYPQDFERVVESVVAELKTKFKDGLNEKLQIGASNVGERSILVPVFHSSSVAHFNS